MSKGKRATENERVPPQKNLKKFKKGVDKIA